MGDAALVAPPTPKCSLVAKRVFRCRMLSQGWWIHRQCPCSNLGLAHPGHGPANIAWCFPAFGASKKATPAFSTWSCKGFFASRMPNCSKDKSIVNIGEALQRMVLHLCMKKEVCGACTPHLRQPDQMLMRRQHWYVGSKTHHTVTSKLSHRVSPLSLVAWKLPSSKGPALGPFCLFVLLFKPKKAAHCWLGPDNVTGLLSIKRKSVINIHSTFAYLCSTYIILILCMCVCALYAAQNRENPKSWFKTSGIAKLHCCRLPCLPNSSSGLDLPLKAISSPPKAIHGNIRQGKNTQISAFSACNLFSSTMTSESKPLIPNNLLVGPPEVQLALLTASVAFNLPVKTILWKSKCHCQSFDVKPGIWNLHLEQNHEEMALRTI